MSKSNSFAVIILICSSCSHFGSDSEAERSIDGPGAFALAKARLPSLRILDLSWNAVPPDAIAALVSSRFAIELHELNLCRTSVAAQAHRNHRARDRCERPGARA